MVESVEAYNKKWDDSIEDAHNILPALKAQRDEMKSNLSILEKTIKVLEEHFGKSRYDTR